MRKALLLLAMLAVFLGPALAVSQYGDIVRDGNRMSPPLANFKCTYERSCVNVSWDRGSTHAGTDFNNYRIVTRSNVAEFDGLDKNVSATEYTFCTIAPGEWLKVAVYKYDSNVYEPSRRTYYMNVAPDMNCVIAPGTLVQSGEYLMYSAFVGFGSVVVIIIFVVVAILLFSRMKITLWK